MRQRQPNTGEVKKNVISDQGIYTLLLGAEEERLNEIARVLKGISDRIFVHPIVSTKDSRENSGDCRLVMIADAEPSTFELFDRLDGSFDSTILKLACIPLEEVTPNLDELLSRVDDILLHPEELVLRLPFLDKRLVIREKSELQNRAILETIVDGIITIDSEGEIKSFNPAAEKIFGYTSSAMVGKNVSMLMPSPHREVHTSFISDYERTGVAKIIGIGREVVGLKKSGDQFPMDLAVSEIYTAGQKLYTGVVRDVTERRQLEQEILRISDQERRRIGQDLHDGLGQMLTGIGLIAQSLVGRLEREGSGHVDDMIEVAELIKEADQNARTLARGLVPVELDDYGLEDALHMMVRNVERLFGVSCKVDRSGTLFIRDTSATTNLYRIAQESVSNAIKHGKAENVEISLRTSDGKVELIVTDDGIGFPQVLPDDRGMGVRIMKYRARIIGATLEIRSGSKGGTTVSCILAV